MCKQYDTREIIEKQRQLAENLLGYLDDALPQEIEDMQWIDQTLRGAVVLAMRSANIRDEAIADAICSLPWAFGLLSWDEMQDYYQMFCSKVLKSSGKYSPGKDLHDE